MQTEPSLPLEKLAAVAARIQAGLPRERVLAEAGLTSDAWERAHAAWLAHMAREATRNKSRKLHVRYIELLRAHRQKALEEKREAARKLQGDVPVPPAARLSPLAAEYRPGAEKRAQGIDVIVTRTVERTVDVAPGGRIEPVAVPFQRGTHAAPPQPPVHESAEATEGEELLTQTLFLADAPHPRRQAPLPFKPGPTDASPQIVQREQRPPKASTSTPSPSTGRHSADATGGDGLLTQTLPFDDLPHPRRKDPLPFKPGPIGASPQAVQREQRPPNTSTSTPSPIAGRESAKATEDDSLLTRTLPFDDLPHPRRKDPLPFKPIPIGASPRDVQREERLRIPQEEENPLEQTIVPLPSASPRAPLPFVRSSGAPAPAPPSACSTGADDDDPEGVAKTFVRIEDSRQQKPPALPFVRAASLATTPPAPPVSPEQPVLPFQRPTPPPTRTPSTMAAHTPSASPPNHLDLSRYACLCAELAVFPTDSERIFVRYGLGDPKLRTSTDAAWRARLQKDAQLYGAWQEHYRHYHAYWTAEARKAGR